MAFVAPIDMGINLQDGQRRASENSADEGNRGRIIAAEHYRHGTCFQDFPGLGFNELAVAFTVPGLGWQISEIGDTAGAITKKWTAQIKVPMIQPFTVSLKSRAERIG